MPAQSSPDRQAEIVLRGLCARLTQPSEVANPPSFSLGEGPRQAVVELAKPHARRLAESAGDAAGRTAAHELVKAQLADDSYFGLSLAEALEALQRVAKWPLSVLSPPPRRSRPGDDDDVSPAAEQDRRDVADRAVRFIEDCVVDLERLANSAELLARITGVQGDQVLEEQGPIVKAQEQYGVERLRRYAGARWLADRLEQTERSGFVVGVRAGLQAELKHVAEVLHKASTTLREIAHEASATLLEIPRDGHPVLSNPSPQTWGDAWKSTAQKASVLLQELEPLVGNTSVPQAGPASAPDVQAKPDALSGLAALVSTRQAVEARQPATTTATR